MPVIVVGADTPGGSEIVDRLMDREGQVRVFVSDRDAAARFREIGAKVATGDISDFGHVQAAMTRCFTAVLLTEAIADGREVAFARNSEVVAKGWRRALKDAAVHRAIWVTTETVEPATPEHAVLDPGSDDLAERIAELDERASL